MFGPKTMRDDIQINYFECEDIDSIIKIENVSFTAPWSKEAYIDLAYDETIRFFVVKLNKAVVGYILYQIVENEIELHTIAVKPEMRKQGIAEKMLKLMIDDAKSNKISDLFLQVRKTNIAAISLYSKFGFINVGIRPNYYTDNHEDAFIMQLKLSN